jgi:hypothetical protein
MPHSYLFGPSVRTIPGGRPDTIRIRVKNVRYA